MAIGSGLPTPSPADLPDPGIKLGSLALQVDSLPSELTGEPLIRKDCVGRQGGNRGTS